MITNRIQLVTAGLILLMCRAWATVHYVNLSNTVPVSPFTSWATAATNIQDAIDISNSGDSILVSDGLYKTGSRYVSGRGDTRVAVTKPVTIQSVNGPGSTSIGGLGAVRCVYLTNGAFLSGFSLAGGATSVTSDDTGYGGGLYCESTSSCASNCTIAYNSAYLRGGGVYRGTLVNCQITGNSIGGGYGGGTYNAVLTNCFLRYNSAKSGGAVYGGTLDNCRVTENSASQTSGGAHLATLNNCQIDGNRCSNWNGAASQCTLNNCTITGNSSSTYGGVSGSTLNNCIVYSNGTPQVNWTDSCTMNYCCTTPMPTAGAGNITNAPLLVYYFDGTWRLQPASPCINAGRNGYVQGSTDLVGYPRIQGGTVDIGAYEFQTPSSILSYAWAQQYGLRTDGTDDFLDVDGDGMCNYAECKASTNPTNHLSVLKMVAPSCSNAAAGVVISWESVTNVMYYLQRSPSLSCPLAFTSIQSNIAGRIGITSFTDSAATNTSCFFYRLGVQ